MDRPLLLLRRTWHTQALSCLSSSLGDVCHPDQPFTTVHVKASCLFDPQYQLSDIYRDWKWIRYGSYNRQNLLLIIQGMNEKLQQLAQGEATLHVCVWMKLGFCLPNDLVHASALFARLLVL
jgi:hypothetical protein